MPVILTTIKNEKSNVYEWMSADIFNILADILKRLKGYMEKTKAKKIMKYSKITKAIIKGHIISPKPCLIWVIHQQINGQE